jgi:hypothetical protein
LRNTSLSALVYLEHPEELPMLTRRAILKKAAYVAPALITLPVLPSLASAGSGEHKPHKPPKKKPR